MKPRTIKIAVVLGTRPEIIKMSPIIRALDKLSANFILHTGQHYSFNMDRTFFEQLELPAPKYNLNVGSGTHGEETGKMLMRIEKILVEEKPDVVLVEGDTNTVLAGALAAAKQGIRVGHVEAGLRSYDRSMPEEINRLLTDHISNLLFAPTDGARENLLKEGIGQNRIHVTGNTIVDAVYQNLKLAEHRDLGLEAGGYLLLTLHRQENVDNPQKLSKIMKSLEALFQRFEKPIICPIHPRTKKRLEEFKIKVPAGIKIMEPLDYLSFLKLESGASLILTDSGGVQEEACILKVPCVTLRDNTERQETLKVGANAIAGTEPDVIVKKASEMLKSRREWENPFGDGHAAERILNIIFS